MPSGAFPMRKKEALELQRRVIEYYVAGVSSSFVRIPIRAASYSQKRLLIGIRTKLDDTYAA